MLILVLIRIIILGSFSCRLSFSFGGSLLIVKLLLMVFLVFGILSLESRFCCLIDLCPHLCDDSRNFSYFECRVITLYCLVHFTSV